MNAKVRNCYEKGNDAFNTCKILRKIANLRFLSGRENLTGEDKILSFSIFYSSQFIFKSRNLNRIFKGLGT